MTRPKPRGLLSGATIRDTLIGVLRPLSKTQTHVKATGPTKAPSLLPNPEERKGLKEAQHVAHSHPSQAHRTISASLEGSGSTLERVTHLRLARGQRTCPRAGGQSPPRSRTADLPSSRWPISASLETVSWHKGQAAPPPNQPPYEGIKGQPLRHDSKDGRRQTATPTVDVAGVPSTYPGHRSATPVAVPTQWAFNAGQDRLAPPPLLFRRHQPSELTSRWGRGLAMSRALPRGALCMRGRDPRPPSCGVRDFHALPDLLMCTPALRPGGPGLSHTITITRILQDGRRHLHWTKDEIQDDSDVRRLPTVHFLQCSTTVPAIQGRTTTSAPLHSCTPPLLTTIKGEGGLPFTGADPISPIQGWKQAL